MGFREWQHQQNEARIKQDERQLRIDDDKRSQKTYEKFAHTKADDTKKWRNEKKAVDSIKLAEKVNGTYSGGTTVQEIINEFGKPDLIEDVLNDSSLKELTWTSNTGDPITNCIKVTITNDSDYSKAQVVKVDNRLLNRDED